jgi:hypothetical protein
MRESFARCEGGSRSGSAAARGHRSSVSSTLQGACGSPQHLAPKGWTLGWGRHEPKAVCFCRHCDWDGTAVVYVLQPSQTHAAGDRGRCR